MNVIVKNPTGRRKLILFIAFLTGFCGLFSISWYGTLLYSTDEYYSDAYGWKEGIHKALAYWPSWDASNTDRFVENNKTENATRIFCWVLTRPSNVEKATSVKHTWLKRCDGYVFISSEDSSTLPAVDAHLGEGRDILWGKTKFGFRYAYNFIDDYDWFLKADDDTYVILENLRLLVSNYSSKNPLYFGHHFKPIGVDGYMSGGAGYLLSQAALRLFVDEGLDNKACGVRYNNGPEDAQMGICLHSLGVTFGDSRDSTGHNRFFPLKPADHMEPGHMQADWWYPKYVKYPQKEVTAVGENSPDCCSDVAITFHYISDMYYMEYMLYHLRPYRQNALSKTTGVL